MLAFVRSAGKVFLALQIPLAFACADSGPGGPGEPAGARLAGLFTLSEVAEAGSGDAFHGAAALAGARVGFLAQDGQTVASVTTGASGAFSAALPPGSYTVSLAMSVGPPLEFGVSLPPGGALFAAGRVDQTPAGGFTLNVQVFNDDDSDGAPDDPFRTQILDLQPGDPGSGLQDVVASAEEAAEVVTLCHVPPGNPDAAHTVEVGAPAVPAHLAHGDTEGECADEGEGDGEGEGEDEAKVLVCHVPPGNPDAAHTIEVGESALDAHLAHGDTEGECAEGEGEGDGEGEGEDEAKVLVCHVPPGNPDAAHTIEIGESAVDAHLAHGDTEGECAEAAEGEGDGEGEGDAG